MIYVVKGLSRSASSPQSSTSLHESGLPVVEQEWRCSIAVHLTEREVQNHPHALWDKEAHSRHNPDMGIHRAETSQG